MVQTGSILIVGGGVGGMSAALSFMRDGRSITLIDSDPHWRVYGAGITVTCATLRAFGQLGVLEEIRAHGFLSRGVRLFTPDGQLINELIPPPLGEGISGIGGIMRPVLHRILSRRVVDAGADIRLGVTVTAIHDDGDAAIVEFSDGSTGRYDLVVGADGFLSATRSLLFPDAPAPRYTGQACWRMVAPRPPELDHAEFFLGRYKVGIVPCSPTELYLFVLDNLAEKTRYPDEALIPRLRELLQPFGGRIPALARRIGPESSVIYRPLEAMLLPRPWHRGRVVLIGDAAHSTTPHLASGAGMAVEDAIVLAQEVAAASNLDSALSSFEDRRFERCRMVVENSVALGDMEIRGADGREFHELMAASERALAAPI